MKRTIAALILAAAAVVCFAEGTQEASDKPVTITFYHYATQTHVLYLNPLKEAFQKAYPNITIKTVEVSTGGYEALSQKILLALAAADAPDVGQMGYNLLARWWKAAPRSLWTASWPRIRSSRRTIFFPR